MKKLMICSALAAVVVPSAAIAHPFNLRFESRGACEKKQAAVNHFDRDFVAGPIFGIDNNGEAQVFFLESFQCEFDEEEGMWRIADHRGDDSAVGEAWDD